MNSLHNAAKALFDRYQSNNCKIDGETNDVFLMEDLRLAIESTNASDSPDPVEWAEWKKLFGIDICNNCNGSGYDPNPMPTCCGNPENGECCGVPEPMWEQCRACK